MRIVEWAPVSFNGSLPSFGAAFESHLAEIGNGAAYRSSASAWSLLYRVLERCGLPVGTVAFGEHGKPFFSDADVFFSLSHAGDLVAVSVSDAPTGVDVERADRKISSRIEEKCLCEREKQAYDGDFIRLWCRKECIVKLTGEGIYGYPNKIDTGDGRYGFYETLLWYGGRPYRLTAAFSETDAARL